MNTDELKKEPYIDNSPIPEVVTLMGQTEEEVKKLLEKDPIFKNRKKETLLYNDCSVEGMPIVNAMRGKCDFKKDLSEFTLWRKLAGVNAGDKEELENIETVDIVTGLMDFIILRLSKTFPNLKFAWTNTWNPSLTLNDSITQISIDKLNIAYKGLLALTDDLNAQAIIVAIISKKLKALFV